MNCTVCGRRKQHKNLEGGVCRSCRRAGLKPRISMTIAPDGADHPIGLAAENLRMGRMSENVQMGTFEPSEFAVEAPELRDGAQIYGEDYEPSENAQVEGSDMTLEQFGKLHHKTQERLLREMQIPWTPGEDREKAYRAHVDPPEPESP